MKLLNRIKARIRLVKIQDQQKKVTDLAYAIRKALDKDCFTEEDKARVLKIVNTEEQERLKNKIEASMKEVVSAERAHEEMRLINLKYF